MHRHLNEKHTHIQEYYTIHTWRKIERKSESGEKANEEESGGAIEKQSGSSGCSSWLYLYKLYNIAVAREQSVLARSRIEFELTSHRRKGSSSVLLNEKKYMHESMRKKPFISVSILIVVRSG